MATMTAEHFLSTQAPRSVEESSGVQLLPRFANESVTCMDNRGSGALAHLDMVRSCESGIEG